MKTRLDNFLVESGYYETRSRAASAIKAGKVIVDGRPARKPSEKVSYDNVIEASAEHPWVSRGGVKLDHALMTFNLDVTGRVCLDVGASTGGFTDVLLSRGAQKIYAVDVGRDQLHQKLKGDTRVVSMEGTDARDLSAEMFDMPWELVVCDASFISAAKVLKQPLILSPTGTDLVTLVKPQFEVGRDNIGRGGIVKDSVLADQALRDFSQWLEIENWRVISTDQSPIKGGDGNTEFLLHACKK